ncbi:M15 family metallopeptidase [Microbacterium horticulturae]|uniref:M15 family metallopeptidase n=1 Tax=Microbacterium horticulturae TaxID=3028316 RepID=A0ABY8C5Z6_9MICO|nr:M15 family metallopeptidase [Microbacterium sp. KACC 23027]WEG10747.1 M15 family metallopeptidase [Microbacterium sp. KACC 23027]
MHAPLTRRALREARAQADLAERADTATIQTLPIPIVQPDDDGPSHPPIFKPPPPPLPPGGLRPVLRPLTTEHAHARHARKPRVGLTARISVAAASALVLAGAGSAFALSQLPDQNVSVTAGSTLVADITGSKVGPRMVDPTGQATKTPAAQRDDTVPSFDQSLASIALCDTDDFTTALKNGDDAAAIRAAGGAEPFRDAVADGQAPCVPLTDPTHVWVVVDKAHALDPKDYAPSPRQQPGDMKSLDGSGLRTDAADALTALDKAVRKAGAGQIALNSGYRSYKTQIGNYGTQKEQRGTKGADAVSARPGYSEHQTGLAADIVPCTGGSCATLDDVADSAQGDWLVKNSWKYGWIVRYEKGETGVTGYAPEPWHLRYIGRDLAEAYQDGGYRTLEQFFGLPAAPDYAD